MNSLYNKIYVSNSPARNVRKDICFLTAIMCRVRVGQTKRTDAKPTLDVWNHFACLFSTGIAGDRNAARVVAVTGTLTVGHVQAAVFARHGRLGLSDAAGAGDMNMSRVKPTVDSKSGKAMSLMGLVGEARCVIIHLPPDYPYSYQKNDP